MTLVHVEAAKNIKTATDFKAKNIFHFPYFSVFPFILNNKSKTIFLP